MIPPFAKGGKILGEDKIDRAEYESYGLTVGEIKFMKAKGTI